MKKTNWLISREVDLLFCCGGAVWIFTAFLTSVHAASSVIQAQMAYPILFLAQLIGYCFANPHTAATYFRVYSNEETRKRWAFQAYVLPFAAGALLIYGLTHLETGPVFAKLYLIFVMPHWMGQIYGIGLLYCYRNGFVLSRFEKRSYWLVMQLTALLVVLQQFLPGYGPPFFIVQTPQWFILPYWVYETVLVIFAAVLSLLILSLLKKFWLEKQVVPFPALMVSVTGLLLQVPEVGIFSSVKLYMLGLYHGSQYLVVCAAYYLRENRPTNYPIEKSGSLLWTGIGARYWAMNIVGGILIYMVAPKIIEDFTAIPIVKSFPIVFGVANFHHFLVDSRVWKLRRPEVQRVLFNPFTALRTVAS